ncbi:MAG TPA: HAMP domain-containing sensor histidine kinase [Gemmatimonadaceae bacterium]
MRTQGNATEARGRSSGGGRVPARPDTTHPGIGLFSIVLGVVLLLMLGGLVVADQALRRADNAQSAVDANASAVLLTQVLDAQLQELEVFGLLETPRDRADTGGITADLGLAFAAHRGALERAWITDSTGRVRADTAFGGRVPATGTVPDADRARAVAKALNSGRPAAAVIRQRGAQASLVLAAPLRRDGRVAGVAAAEYDARRLVAPILDVQRDTRSWIAITAGTDTIVAIGTSGGRTRYARALVTLPGGGVWALDVSHTPPMQALRLTLWMLGLMGLIFLSVGVFRERRQALRISERSAELERLSTELLRANRMKSEFLANVSHELRTPLNAVVGFVDLLRDGVYGELSPRQTPPVDRIAASATHLRHLVDQVLDIAKMAAGRLEVHAESIALRPFVLNVVGELESLINERGLSLSIAVGASLPRVRTDPTHLRQILVNLIGNAVKYTPAGGISVRARLVGVTRRVAGRRLSPDDPGLAQSTPDERRVWVALQVIDTGIGIAPADCERIFDEFEQVNAGPRGESMQRGTGLGLAISRRLARLLGGDIAVESEPGRGSTFTVWLPVNTADLERDGAARLTPGVASDAAV